MDELTFRCVCCMHEKPDNGICPHCGAEEEQQQDPACLPLRYSLADRYFIGVPVRRNGESTTYLAYDNEYGCTCLVREFFPPTLSKRSFENESVVPIGGCENLYNEYKSEFLTLWEKIRRLRGLPGLVSVTDILEQNDTVYAVSPSTDEISLREFLQKQPGSLISWEQARIMFIPLISSLTTLHSADILHRGISPDTLTVDKDGRVRLTDFAIPQLRTTKTEIDPELFDGYCAIEQYDKTQLQGTWTDVYAFAAIMFRCLTGYIPIAAPFRAVEDTMAIPARIARMIPDYVIDAIIDGMQIYPTDRTQTFDEFRAMIAAPTEYVPPKRTVEETAPVVEEPEEVEEEETEQESADISEAEALLDEYATEEDEQATEVSTQADEKKKRTALDNAITILLVVILVLTLAGIGFVVKYLSSYIEGEPLIQDTTVADTNETVTVPNCLGLTADVIQNTPDIWNNFNVKFILVTGSSRAYGQVDKQSLRFGDAVPVGSELLLSVSALALPDMTGLPIQQVKETLDTYGLTYYTEYKNYAEEDRTKSGTVAYTTPSNATAVVPGNNKMYAKDGNYYDVLIVVWSYGNVSDEVIPEVATSESVGVPDSNVFIDIDLGYNNSVG